MKVVIKVSEKDLHRLPSFIFDRLFRWVGAVREVGLQKVRAIPGYHDEPLKGSRAGQRSIRLNRAYRAIYIESEMQNTILVIEVNKHGY